MFKTVRTKSVSAVTSMTSVAREIKENAHSAPKCSKRSLALASIQTRKPGAVTGRKKCLQSSVGFDLPALH